MTDHKLHFLEENRSLFWSTFDLAKLNDETIVETILNYGNEKNIGEMIDLIGKEKVVNVFYKQLNQKRNNYRPATENFFNIYFSRHA